MAPARLCLVAAATLGLAVPAAAARVSAAVGAHFGSAWRGQCPGGISCDRAPDDMLDDVCKWIAEGKHTVSELSTYLNDEKCIRCSISQLKAKCAQWDLENGPKEPPSREQCLTALVAGVQDYQTANPQYSEGFAGLCQDFGEFANGYFRLVSKRLIFKSPKSRVDEAKAKLAAAWKGVESAAQDKSVEGVNAALREVEAVVPLEAEAMKAYSVDWDVCTSLHNLIDILCDAWMPICKQDSRATWAKDKELSCQNVMFSAAQEKTEESSD